MTRPLTGRRILVTGGATGIGAAAVDVFVDAGAHVVATYHVTPPPEVSDALWLHCDVRDSPAIEATFDKAVSTLNGLDVVVHAAGLWQPGIPGRIDEHAIDFLLSTNVKATILVNQAAYTAMHQTGGQIINFGSSEAMIGSPISAVYSASKGAVQAWTRSAARAWAAHKVTVNAIAPAVDTPGADRLRDFLGPAAGEFMKQQLKSRIPLGGALGAPINDLGPALVFLASAGAHFITGQLLAVDGGLLMLGS